MTVLVPLGLAVLGLVVVIVFSERLVKATVGVARTAGLSTFLIAVIFLGFDPENLAVGAVGVQQGATGLALGTVLGSAMVAIALAVGVAAVIVPMRFAAVPRPILGLTVAVVVGFAALAADGRLSRVDGAVLLAAYPVTVVALIWLGRRGLDVQPSGEVAKTLTKQPGRTRPVVAVLVLLVCLAGIVVGGELLVYAAQQLIGGLGLSQTAIGMSVLALAISAEELGRTVPAARAGRPEIAVGNLVGSVLAFFCFNAGIIALIAPLELDPVTQRFYLPVVVGTVVLVCALLLTRRLTRTAGVLLVLVYLGFVVVGFLLSGDAAAPGLVPG